MNDRELQGKQMAEGHIFSGQSNQTWQPGRNTVPPPDVQTLRDKLQELLGYLNEADIHTAGIRERIAGPSPSCPENGRSGGPNCLEELVLIACQRAACLAGELSTIGQRL